MSSSMRVIFGNALSVVCNRLSRTVYQSNNISSLAHSLLPGRTAALHSFVTPSSTFFRGFLPIAATPTSTTLVQTRSYKVIGVLKKRCAGCYYIRRKNRMFRECTRKNRHKAMLQMDRKVLWREDYSRGHVVKAFYYNYDNEKRYYIVSDNTFASHNWLKDKIGVTL